jgi:DDE superfamily endonuclease
VLLCSNSTGSHKLRPLVIGTSKKPRCFNGINISQLPVIYKNNKKAWMRSDIWEQWLRYINDSFRIQGRKVLLLVDNAASHMIPGTNNIQDDDADEQSSENDSIGEIEEFQEEPQRPRGRSRGRPRGRPLERSRGRRLRETPGLSNITIHFLPPNMTAHIQPMDAGIIHSFKSKYKKLYCRYLINQFEKNQSQE